MHQVNIAIAIAGAVVILLGLVSERLEYLPLSKPLLALGTGIAVGPALLGWLAPHQWPNPEVIVREAARFTLAISVFGVAIRTPREDYLSLLRPVALLVVAAMMIMWLVSAGLAVVLLGVSPMLALLLGAIVTPTDPVVASSIVTGKRAEQVLPDRLRTTLSLESGANDGLAYLIVLLPLLLISGTAPEEGFGRWLVEAVLMGVLLAMAAGSLIGVLAALGLRHADKHHWVERHSLLSYSVAISLFAVAAAKLLGSDGILAAFAAGVAFNLCADRREDFQEQRVQESISKLFTLPIFVLLGAMLPWREWSAMGWSVLGYAIAVLLLRRPLALLLLSRALSRRFARRDLAFLGWFGPVGVAALYYALLAQERTQDATPWHVASLVIVVSVVAHGLTSAPGMKLYRREKPASKGPASQGSAPTTSPRLIPNASDAQRE